MKEVDYTYIHVPLVYLDKKSGSNANLVIVDIKGSAVLYSYRSQNTCRVGMVKRSKLEIGKNGKRYFTVRGKKIEIPRTYGWVM